MLDAAVSARSVAGRAKLADTAQFVTVMGLVPTATGQAVMMRLNMLSCLLICLPLASFAWQNVWPSNLAALQ